MKIYQLTQASLGEIQDFSPEDTLEGILDGNPLFTSIEKAKAFAEILCREIAPEFCDEADEDGAPVLEWMERDGVIGAVFGDDECGQEFRIHLCPLDPDPDAG